MLPTICTHPSQFHLHSFNGRWSCIQHACISTVCNRPAAYLHNNHCVATRSMQVFMLDSSYLFIQDSEHLCFFSFRPTNGHVKRGLHVLFARTRSKRLVIPRIRPRHKHIYIVAFDKCRYECRTPNIMHNELAVNACRLTYLRRG